MMVLIFPAACEWNFPAKEVISTKIHHAKHLD